MTIRTAIGRSLTSIAEPLPAKLRTRLLGSAWQWQAKDTRAQILPNPDDDARIFIGFANYAGQGTAWAKALREVDGIDARNGQPTRAETAMTFPADLTVPVNAWRRSSAWAKRQFEVLSREYTHVLVESGLPILGSDSRGDLIKQVRKLQDAGVKVGLLWHGSDIRIPHLHAKEITDSPFQNANDALTANLEERSMRNLALAEELDLVEFVSTPDLLRYRPNATWLPTLINQELWKPVTSVPTRTRKKPIVAHVPSRSALKGTENIRAVTLELERQGLIEYREISGVAPEQMPQIIKDADIVIDQLGMDLYGIASLEALSQGKTVICQVGERVRRHVAQSSSAQVPLVDATSATLRERLMELIEEPEAAAAQAQKGLQYLETVHSPENAARVLLENFVQ